MLIIVRLTCKYTLFLAKWTPSQFLWVSMGNKLSIYITEIVFSGKLLDRAVHSTFVHFFSSSVRPLLLSFHWICLIMQCLQCQIQWSFSLFLFFNLYQLLTLYHIFLFEMCCTFPLYDIALSRFSSFLAGLCYAGSHTCSLHLSYKLHNPQGSFSNVSLYLYSYLARGFN